MKRFLVVMHGTNIVYGAGRSLITWINNSNIEYDLLYAKFPFNNDSVEYLMSHLINKPKRVLSMWLCTDQWCICGKKDLTWRGVLFTIFSNTMFYINRRSYKKTIQRYEKVYLNSLVLWPLITSNDKFYIHVREIFEGSVRKFRRVSKSLRKAKGVIYIDWASCTPFKDEKIQSTVLNNPFDMRAVANIDRDALLRKLCLEKGKTIYAVVGKIDRTKGIDIIIKAFNKAKVDAYLLIVGTVKGKYAKMCVNICKENHNIVFTGEIKDNNKVYAMADYILRGEKQFCIGRTIYEGLYSGDNVIIPGDISDINKMEEKDRFREQIYFYEPSSVKDLVRVIHETNGKNIGNQRIGNSNVVEYVEKITGFIGV